MINVCHPEQCIRIAGIFLKLYCRYIFKIVIAEINHLYMYRSFLPTYK